ncbi:MAG TPA: DUF4389 domain-containing protein [Gaiellaceae bacterium]|nr:DUF4389 domain-containing protein [Gaiellaceae bacterium]
MDHPIRLVVTDDLKRSRLTVLFRGLLVIPHLIWLVLWGIAAWFVLIVAWFAALFTKHVPLGMHNFLAGFLCYQVHVFAYMTITANPYPAFSGSADYPVTVEIAPPMEQGRLGVFFRFLLAIPAFIVAGVLNYLTYVLVLFAWILALILGRIPEGMRNLQAFSIRYHAQTQAYGNLLTSRYPSFNVGLDS